jgi:hypothetical protein
MRPAAQLISVAITGPHGIWTYEQRRAASARTRSNCRRSGIAFIDHSVARSRFMSGLEVAQRGREDIELLHATAIIARAPEATRKAHQPLKWVTTIPGDGGRTVSASVIADDLFALRFLAGN